MIADQIMRLMPGCYGLGKLVICSNAVALLISLGMVGIASFFGFQLGTVIPSVFAAIGAALFAAWVSRHT